MSDGGLRPHPHLPSYMGTGAAQPPLAFQPSPTLSQSGGGSSTGGGSAPPLMPPYLGGRRDGSGLVMRPSAGSLSSSFGMSDSESVALGTAMRRTESMESFLTVGSSGQSDDESGGNNGGQHDKKKRRLQKNRWVPTHRPPCRRLGWLLSSSQPPAATVPHLLTP